MGYFSVEQTRLHPVFRLEDPNGVFMTLIVGKSSAFLADTGMGIGDSKAAVRQITGLPLIVANTHGHIDHMGGNYQFESVWQSGLDLAVARKAVDVSVKRRILDMPNTPVPKDFDSTAFFRYTPDNLINLEPNARFELGGLTVIAVPLPSHTPGSMGFLCPELGLLLSGDCISPIVYLVFEESCSIAQHISILRHAESLPFEHIFSSHNKELIQKSSVKQYIQCAESVIPELSIRFRHPLFPDTPGKMYVHRNPENRNEYSALVYAPDKLNGIY